MSKLQSILHCGFNEENRLYFGDMVHVYEKDVCGRTIIETMTENGWDDMEIDLTENGLVVIQLDDNTKMDLLKKGNRISKNWSVWAVLDFVERIVVIVIWKQVSSVIQATGMNCVSCRSEQSIRYHNKLSCELESELETEGSHAGEHVSALKHENDIVIDRNAENGEG